MALKHPSDIPLSRLYHLLQPITVTPSNTTFTNWSRSFACAPIAIFEPETEYECELIVELARRENRTVRAAGMGHSPSDLACTSGYMLSTLKLNKVIEVNVHKRYVVAQGGTTLDYLHKVLGRHGLAMVHVPSISDQTLAGMISAASHGSGIHFGVLSTHTLALTLLLADGSKITCSRSERSDLFYTSLCGLGCTGLILSIQFEVEPSFRLKEVQETIDFNDGIDHMDEIASAAEHVRLWWYPACDAIRVSYADRTQQKLTLEAKKGILHSWFWEIFLGYHLLQLALFVGRYLTGLNPWIARFALWLSPEKLERVDESHLIFNIDCKFLQHTTEWSIPYEETGACLREIRTWLQGEFADPNGLRPHFPMEIRFSSADDVWLSPSYGRRSCWIGIIQFKPYGFNVPYRKLFRTFEDIVSRHGGRPHWAKAHRLRPDDLRKLYPCFDDFVRVLSEIDPGGMFRNEYVNRHIFGHEVDERIFKPLRHLPMKG